MKYYFILEKDIEESKDIEVSNGSDDDDIQEIHPFKYMLGNLMKKMDDNKTKACALKREEVCQTLELPNNPCEEKTEVSKDNNVNAEGNRICEEKLKFANTYKQNTEHADQTAYKRKTEVDRQIAYQRKPEEPKRRANQQTIEATNKNNQEMSHTKLKPIKFVRATEEPKEILCKQQPEEVKLNEYQRTTDAKRESYERKRVEANHESYERTIEQSKVARQNAQKLHCEQQMSKNKRIEEKLIKVIINVK